MRDKFILPLVIGVVVILWNTPLIYPIKLLVVFFHESSHALMALITGGSVHEMVVTSIQGGHVISSGGSRLLTLNAGYLGSMLWGAVIYLLACHSRWDRLISTLLGLLVVVITLLFVRNLFGMVFGMGAALALVALGRYGSEPLNDLLLRCIGMTNMLYVPLDIYSDTISRDYLRSDARMLAEEFGGFTMLWGGIWLLLSLFFLYRVIQAGKSAYPSS